MATTAVLLLAGTIFLWGVVSGRLERDDLTAPVVFVAVGGLFAALHIVDTPSAMASFKVVVEVTLVWVLFSDAAGVPFRDVRQDLGRIVRLLAIGLPLTVLAGWGLALWLLPSLGIWLALLVGAALAPTDAALGLPVVTNPAVPSRIRKLITVESGLNDGIVTPVVMFALAGAATAEGIHGASGLWAALAEAGHLEGYDLTSYGGDGATLIMSTHEGHPPLIELTGGSLGHGLGVAAGLAVGYRINGWPSRIFNFMTDGEIQEGSTWESAMFAGHERLGNLVNVIDVNRTQADGALVLEIEPLVDKWRAFGWWAEEVDGHDIERLLDVFEAARGVRDVPKAIVCRTTLGQGVPLIMERERNHFVRVGDDEWDAVARQLEASE